MLSGSLRKMCKFFWTLKVGKNIAECKRPLNATRRSSKLPIEAKLVGLPSRNAKWRSAPPILKEKRIRKAHERPLKKKNRMQQRNLTGTEVCRLTLDAFFEFFSLAFVWIFSIAGE